MRTNCWLLMVGFVVWSNAADAQEITLESVPPVVVKAVPEPGSRDVDPNITEIRVTFSKEMQNGNWSWCFASKESWPGTEGKPTYAEDKRTCVLPVKLQPGRTYAVWVNNQKFQNFKDATGQAAVPYLLVFRTKG